MSATFNKCGYMSLAVCCDDDIIHLEWFDCDDEEYQSGWYWFEDDGPPGFFGKTAKEAADELRKFIKQAAGKRKSLDEDVGDPLGDHHGRNV